MQRPDESPLFERAEARPEFRAGLRRDFVQGSGRFADATGAGEVREPHEAQLGALLRRSAAPEAADVRFAAALRAGFVSGALGEATQPVGPEAQPSPEAVPAPRLAPVLRPRFATLRRVGVPLFAAAAALLAALSFWWAERAPAWTVFNQRSSVALVDGSPLHVENLRPGTRACELCTTSKNLRFGYGDLFRIELAKDSSLHLPSPSVDERGRVSATIGIQRGEIVCVARRDPDLAALVIETPTAFVTLTSGSLSILVLPGGGACICVREGEVTVASKSGVDGAEAPVHVVTDGQRAHVGADGALGVFPGTTDERRMANLSAACDDLAGERFEADDYARGWNVLEVF
jgi:ferric-dicitrate binding protein FerR (iron transport regulator)